MVQTQGSTEDFSENYQQARARFRDAAGQLGWSLAQYDCHVTAPNGQHLACDVAVSTESTNVKHARHARHAKQGKHAVIVSSGLHGVEGYFGSAVQHAWMRRHYELAERQPIRFVFLHALNPYGFACHRRCDAENVDPNRNFVLDGEYRGSQPLYARLNGLLNPPRAPARGMNLFRLQAILAIARFGFAALQQAVAEGQYDFPNGLFYGGQHACWTRRLLELHLLEWIGDCATVVHVDLHTGLGKWATHKLLLDYTPTDVQRRWLGAQFGDGLVQELAAKGAAYESRGGLGAWCQQLHASMQYVYVCAEFGTYGPLTVIEALRAENQAHHWASSDDARTRRVKQRLREVFCPQSAQWRRPAIAGGLQIIDRIVEAISSLPPPTREGVE